MRLTGFFARVSLPLILGVSVPLSGWATPRADAASGTSSVHVTIYPGISSPDGITVGSDGALWFTNLRSDSIGRMTTSGVNVNYSGPGINYPVSITAGPDGSLWFTNNRSNSIGRITTSGAVSNYTGPSIEDPWGITSGPDHALWFTNAGNNTIGRITTTRRRHQLRRQRHQQTRGHHFRPGPRSLVHQRREQHDRAHHH